MNGLLLCRTRCHESQREAKTVLLAKERGWVLHSSQDPARVPVWLSRHGWVLLTPDGGWTATTDPREETAA